MQVPKGLIEKPVRVRYDPVTVIGSGLLICHWVRKYLGRRRTALNLSQENCLRGKRYGSYGR